MQDKSDQHENEYTTVSKCFDIQMLKIIQIIFHPLIFK